MQTVIQKWGNSLGIRIPSMYVREFNLKNGSSVEIVEDNGKIVILPKKFSLEQMLLNVTEDNIHSSVETGLRMGNEEW